MIHNQQEYDQTTNRLEIDRRMTADLERRLRRMFFREHEVMRAIEPRLKEQRKLLAELELYMGQTSVGATSQERCGRRLVATS
jgi:hypothetical protein